MDSSKKHVKASPEERANLISKICYWWFLPFLKFGYKHDVEIRDLYNTAAIDLSAPLTDTLQKNWEKELISYKKGKKKSPSLKHAILKTFWKPFTLSGISLFSQFALIRPVQPIVLAKFISSFDEEETDHNGWIWGSAVILMAFLNCVLAHNSNLVTQRVGMRVRTAVSSLIYRKLLKLNHTSLGETAAGQLVNLLSNDVQRFDLVAPYLNYVWIMPFSAVFTFYILYYYVGIIAASAGMLILSLESIPLQGTICKLQGKLRYKIALRTDSRVKLMDEITSGIQVIKMYAWEKPFEKVVELARKLEVDIITYTSHLYGLLASMGIFTERLILYITLITYVFFGKRLSGNIAFSLTQLFNNIQCIMAINFPRGYSLYSESKVSIYRLEQFLLLDENEDKKIADKNKRKSDTTGKIAVNNVTASWIPKSIIPTLTDINLNIKPGTLCCVVGHVGCGKSSLLHLLLNELPIINGDVEISGKISYASQEPWLFVSNVKNNILFGKSFDKSRYQDVIKVCSLERDLKQLSHGDRTLVGERGVSLSGGQRARVNLARAIYAEADIYLFDDPLSAVDTKVGRDLFDECILTYLSGKTRILVTHQLQFMKKADLIVILNNGRIEKVAKFSELSENELNILHQQPEIDENEKIPETTERRIRKISTAAKFQSATSLASSVYYEDPVESVELIEKGTVSNSTHLEYWRSGSGLPFLLFTSFVFILAQMVTNGVDLWLSYWTNCEAKRLPFNKTREIRPYMEVNSTNGNMDGNYTSLTSVLSETTILPMSTINDSSRSSFLNTVVRSDEGMRSQEYYIWIYSALLASSIMLLIWRSVLYYQICMNASKVLHNKMFSNVLQAPMRFFDTNPSGRILNRFSKDMGAVDEVLPRCSLEAIQVFMIMFGMLGLVFLVIPWMIIPALALAPLFYFIRLIYLTTAQSLKRLEGITKAPVFSHISATLYGITTIRASGAEKLVAKEFDGLQDEHTSAWFLFLVSSTTFGFYLDMLICMFLTIVTLQFLFFGNESTGSGNIGLVMAYSINLTGMVQFGLRQSAEVTSNMISVERVLQYTKLDKEGPFQSLPTKKPPRDWPDKGKIVFKNLYMRYAPDLPPVLKNLSMDVKPGEKIGIVGRTGAGKSSLISALFRLAPIDGTVSVDEIDIAEIGLNDLRLNISIIPQEPVLFSSSLRYNLDPFEKHSDEVLWEALEDVELKDVVTDLSQPVSEGGSNFSAGQRQLICLARAIVRNNKILVMDEATANVDPQTDALIQKTIRERFKNCTVLTIAHRLNTIMDSDRVLVMDAGQAVEFDHAHKLLQNIDGFFNKMVIETGPSMDQTLRIVAKNHYERRE